MTENCGDHRNVMAMLADRTMEVSQEIASGLIYLQDLAAARGEGGLAAEASDALAEMERMRFNVAFVGQFKRGKSSLINAIVGRELLPADVAPITSAITILQHGKMQDCRIVFQDGRQEQVSLDQALSYVSEESNPGNQKCVREVLLDLPLPLLAEGIRLVDTPGLGSIVIANDEVTRNYLPRIDLAIVVLGADPTISREEMDMIRSLAPQAERLVFVLNKSDLVSESVLQKAEDYTRRALNSVLGHDPGHIMRLSAKRALEGTDTQLESLKDFLRTTAQSSRSSLAEGSARRASRYLAGRLLRQLRMERAALEAPLSELDQRIARFQDATRDIEDIMLASFTRAKSEVMHDWKDWQMERNEKIEERKTTMTATLSATARALPVPKMKLRGAISEAARSDTANFLEEWCGYVSGWVEDRFHRQERLVDQETHRILARISDAAKDTFGMELGEFEIKTAKLNLGKISWDLSTDSLALDPHDWIFPILDLLFPRSLVIKMAIHRVKEEREDWLRKNIYRIDEKVIEWLDGATRQLFDFMQAQFETMRREIMNALDAGKKQRECGASAVEKRLKELERQGNRLSDIIASSST